MTPHRKPLTLLLAASALLLAFSANAEGGGDITTKTVDFADSMPVEIPGGWERAVELPFRIDEEGSLRQMSIHLVAEGPDVEKLDVVLLTPNGEHSWSPDHAVIEFAADGERLSLGLRPAGPGENRLPVNLRAAGVWKVQLFHVMSSASSELRVCVVEYQVGGLPQDGDDWLPAVATNVDGVHGETDDVCPDCMCEDGDTRWCYCGQGCYSGWRECYGGQWGDCENCHVDCSCEVASRNGNVVYGSVAVGVVVLLSFALVVRRGRRVGPWI